MSSSDQQIQHGAWPGTAPQKWGDGGAIAPRAGNSLDPILDPIVSLQDTMHYRFTSQSFASRELVLGRPPYKMVAVRSHLLGLNLKTLVTKSGERI